MSDHPVSHEELRNRLLAALFINQFEDQELKELLTQFMSAFELVFHDDWEFTFERIPEASFISDDGTFLCPGMGSELEESNNWGNRGSLLRCYRALRAAMKERSIYDDSCTSISPGC